MKIGEIWFYNPKIKETEWESEIHLKEPVEILDLFLDEDILGLEMVEFITKTSIETLKEFDRDNNPHIKVYAKDYFLKLYEKDYNEDR